MRAHFILLMLLLSTFYSKELFSQKKNTVEGLVYNGMTEKRLPEATISILKAKDSILVTFSYSEPNGTFKFENLASGNYLLLVSYLNYADYVSPFSISTEKSVYNFDTIRMKRQEILLEEVLINVRKKGMKMRGDTIEYDAQAFHIRPNDKVEDLLNRLPGIQVDQYGKIKAQGQTVTRVLLDGEEFFSDDPTLITKNIRADMVDKIQVYDKKSDRAVFTGIDDGIKSRTINVTLKENKKNGLFGKAILGIGTDKYYEGQGMLNRFKNNHKFSAYGTAANDGMTGLSSNNLQNIGSNQITLGGQALVASPVSDDQIETYDGNYSGKGFPKTKNGGAHFDTKWAEGSRSVNADYHLGSININGDNIDITQQNLKESTLNSQIEEHYENNSTRQKLNAVYKMKINKLSDLKINLTSGVGRFDLYRHYLGNTSNALDEQVNTQERSVTNKGDLKAIDINSYYTKKFKKDRRTLSWGMNGAFNANRSEGYLRSRIDYYDLNNSVDSSYTVNQFKKSNIEYFSWTSNIEYTEPLGKKITMLLKYGIAFENSSNDLKSFNYVDGAGFTDLDKNFSNSYRIQQLGNQGGIRFNYALKDKLYFNFGTDATAITFQQRNLTSMDDYKRYFLNWSPQMSLFLKMKTPQFVRAIYSGSNTLPSLAQIQPVLNNTDPLNIRLGNPTLKPSFTNKVEIDYSNNNTKNGKYTYIDFDYSSMENAITEEVITDTNTGASNQRYVNLSGKTFYTYKIDATFGRSFGNSGIRMYLGIGSRRDISYSLINSSVNRANAGNYRASLQLSWNSPNKIELGATFAPDYSINRLSLQSQYNNDAKGYTATGRVRIFLPAKMEVKSDIEYRYRGRTSVFDDFHQTLWNATVSRSFLKTNNLKLSVTGRDLLNQNQRFDRSVAGNIFRQNRASVIKRYIMFSLSWDFTKFATLPSTNP